MVPAPAASANGHARQDVEIIDDRNPHRILDATI